MRRAELNIDRLRLRLRGGDRAEARALVGQVADELAGIEVPAGGRTLGRLVLRMTPRPAESRRELARRIARRIAEGLR